MIPVVRRMLALTLVAVGAWFSVGVAPVPAGAAVSADTCQEYDVTDRDAVLDRADAVTDVFVGRVRSVTELGGGTGRAEDQPRSDGQRERATGWRHEVGVFIAFRGGAQPRDFVRLVTEPAADDGLGRLDVGATYLFFADREGDRNTFTASRCGGTTLLPEGLDADLQRDLQQIFEEPTETPAAEVTFTEPAGGTDEPPSFGRAAAPGVAISLFGLLGLLLLWRMGARRP